MESRGPGPDRGRFASGYPRRERGRLKLGVLLLACTLTQSAWALDEASRRMVRELSQEGVAAYQAGKYDKALNRLEEAYRMLKTAPLAYWSAKALEKLGKLVEASERYRAAERAAIDPDGDPVPQRQAQADARDAREALEPRIPRLVIQLAGATDENTQVRVDSVLVPTNLLGHAIPVNPGRRRVTATNGEREVERLIELSESESGTVTLELPPANRKTSSTSTSARAREPVNTKDTGSGGAGWQPWAGWLSVGVGAAGLGVGTVAAIMVYDKRTEWNCNDAGCPPDLTDAQRSEGEALRTLSATGFIVGGVLVATGVTLLLTTPKKSPSARNIAPLVGFGTLGVSGRF